ncbi:MAG: hypothetical protein A3D50_01465 [Candidatus Taylorbacteria bacterium RIFCSPHIGHO2_02_FULL_44_12]|uniref:Methyltransferase type 11 domain-containing protein n=1 Tax=Candidatus Taylorbacteria bacterium RIFCSPHIGHO2_02_FULL_44_12 TaxID=1802308 RepID=A0A1G2MKS3_9BACT|nr:MAG: hypothetical protein A3D50_01465 [Candidatus Taylorbacteria bacterium RIFCSPHIGHO2_02_FULL_44_12]
MIKRSTKKIGIKIYELLLPLMRLYRVRYWVVWTRFTFLKKKMCFADHNNTQIGEKTISHNLSAFELPRAVFGCGGRMGLLIYPIIGYFSKNRRSKKILVVGCRTEDDIYWLRAYGFIDTYGFDLISYSSNILLGDIHQTSFPDRTYDVILLGWMISYTKDPHSVIKECQRIMKPKGLLGISLEHNPLQDKEGLGSVRVNNLNCTDDIINLLDSASKHKIVFEYDHYNNGDQASVVISRLLS